MVVGAVVVVGVVAVVVGAESNPSTRIKISRKVYKILWMSCY